jgi:acetyltransferase
LAVLTQRVETIDCCNQDPITLLDVDKDKVEEILKEAEVTSAGFLLEQDAQAIMSAYGLPALKMVLAYSPQEAQAVADEIGFPLVMKIASPDIPHKSDIGGVLVGISDQVEVEEGYQKLLQVAKVEAPDAKILGIHLQKMVDTGQEVILGAVQDPQFGALVMFGSGGVEVEGLEDVSFALAPVIEDEIDYLITSTWAGKKLAGYRNLPPSDRPAVEDAIVRLAQLSADFPQISEIEINPLRVLPEGEGAAAVDVRIKLTNG